MTDQEQVKAIRELVEKHKAKAMEKKEEDKQDDVAEESKERQKPVKELVFDGGD